MASFCRAILGVSAAYAVARCLSVLLYVTFVYYVKTSNHILKHFSHLLVFPRQTLWRYSYGDPLN